jgi:hypothetical protein
MEVTQEVEVEFDGEVELNVDKLSSAKAEELLLALLYRKYMISVKDQQNPIVKIPICHSFTTEVTLEVEKDDYI